MKLSDINFKKYFCDPTKKDSLADFEKKYEEYRVDTGSIDKKKLFIYIVLMYDIKSDLRDLYSDINTRKREAAILSGFELNSKNHFEDDVENFLVGGVPEINDMIVGYVKSFNNPDYVTYVAYWEILYAEIKKSFAASNMKSNMLKETRNNIDMVRKVINELQVNIFGGDDNRDLKMALYKSMEREKLRLRPEYIAKDIREKKLEIVDPYYG